MKTLTGEIKEKLSAYDFGFPVTVARSFDANDKTNFPRIVIYEVANMTRDRSATKELTSILGFQVNIYTKDYATDEGEVIGRIEMADNIAIAVDDFMFTEYKMNRDDVHPDTPFSKDTNLRTMRFSCVLDNTHDYTYRH